MYFFKNGKRYTPKLGEAKNRVVFKKSDGKRDTKIYLLQITRFFFSCVHFFKNGKSYTPKLGEAKNQVVYVRLS